MKKIVSVCLALLLLGMTACVSIPMERTEASKTAEKALTAEPTVEPVATEEPTPAPTDTPAPTPTPVPTDTPAPTEIPAEVAVSKAMNKLIQVKSMHMDMDLAMEVEMVISMGEVKQRLPMNITMTGRTDMSREPYLVMTAISLSAMGENMDALLYGAQEDGATVLDDPALCEHERLALVFGTEGWGLSRRTLACCDECVIIPMAAGVDSLNVASSSAVAFWQLCR